MNEFHRGWTMRMGLLGMKLRSFIFWLKWFAAVFLNEGNMQ